MSSKLMDAATVTELVPWRIAELEPDDEPSPMTFEGMPEYKTPEKVAEELERSKRDPPPSHLHEPRIIAEADHQECHRRIEGLEREIQRLSAQALEDKRVAYQQGLEAGITQESAKWSDALARSAKALADLAVVKPKLRFQVEEDAVRLSLAIARKVLRREVTVDPGAIAGLLRVALDKANARDIVRIRTAPQDAQGLSAQLSSFGLPVNVEVIGDGALERGSLLVDTGQGHIDASVETQLQEIERGLADALDRNRNH